MEGKITYLPALEDTEKLTSIISQTQFKVNQLKNQVSELFKNPGLNSRSDQHSGSKWDELPFIHIDKTYQTHCPQMRTFALLLFSDHYMECMLQRVLKSIVFHHHN